MAQVLSEFEEEFEAKRETLFGIAELLYANPDRQYTQQELADRFDCSTTISNHIRDMSKWLDRHDSQTTYAWNVDVYDPGHTETTMAVRRFYADLWWLLKKHSRTGPSALALFGFIMLLTGGVVFSVYVGFALELFAESALPAGIYLGIAIGCLLTGIIVTLCAPYMAWVSGVLWPRLLGNSLEKEE
ncbi:hypothetical protein [Haloarcula sp. H-GB5]